MKIYTVLLSLAVFVLPAVSLASEGELEWNQEHVAALVRDLIEPLDAIRAELESRPPVPEEEGARAAVMTDVTSLQLRARELTQRLADGAGRADTLALFREVETLQSQAAKHSRQYPARFEIHVHVERIQKITAQLARYYGESSDLGEDPDGEPGRTP